jgi:hypothetical protein
LEVCQPFSHQHFSEMLPRCFLTIFWKSIFFLINIFRKCYQHFFVNIIRKCCKHFFSSTFFRSVVRIFSRQYFLEAYLEMLSTFFESTFFGFFQYFPKIFQHFTEMLIFSTCFRQHFIKYCNIFRKFWTIFHLFQHFSKYFNVSQKC